MKIKQFVSKLLYKTERKVAWKIKQRKAAGRSPGNVNCTGFLKRTMSRYWYKAIVGFHMTSLKFKLQNY